MTYVHQTATHTVRSAATGKRFVYPRPTLSRVERFAVSYLRGPSVDDTIGETVRTAGATIGGDIWSPESKVTGTVNGQLVRCGWDDMRGRDNDDRQARYGADPMDVHNEPTTGAILYNGTHTVTEHDRSFTVIVPVCECRGCRGSRSLDDGARHTTELKTERRMTGAERVYLHRRRKAHRKANEHATDGQVEALALADLDDRRKREAKANEPTAASEAPTVDASALATASDSWDRDQR